MRREMESAHVRHRTLDLCGSSSRGVTTTAKMPSRSAAIASSGVICAVWK
jgi:hypothetical protein